MLETIDPREQNGRDSFGRYRAQVRSAAVASLSILKGGEIDRVYCDLHDDFVIRLKTDEGYSYVFFQVKTRGKLNDNWKTSEIFGINSRIKNQDKQSTKKIKDSFVGKLLLHTVVFGENCSGVVFQTNIHNGDDVVSIIEDIDFADFKNIFTRVLIDRFNSCYEEKLNKSLSDDVIKKNLSKLKFQTDVQYLKQDDNQFESTVRDKVYEYSEVDLERYELKEIILKLLDLVENKSSGVIKNITSESIEHLAGISIDDLLSILSISNDAYYSLLSGGDSKAIKSASIIQRTLLNSGASIKEVEYCSRCKTGWDIWIRDNRHIVSEFDLNCIMRFIKEFLSDHTRNGYQVNLGVLRKPMLNMISRLKDEELMFDLSEDLLLGAVFSELVRGK